MGYYVREMKEKKSEPQWKIQFISCKKADMQNSKAKQPKRAWDIPKQRWLALGFYQFMTLEEARARAKQINIQDQLKAQERRRLSISEEERQLQTRFSAVLPEEFVAEFEKRFVRRSDSSTRNNPDRLSRSKVVWRAAQRLIVAIGIEPSDWFYHTHDFYDYFHSKQYSLRYCRSILSYANLWVFFICKKMGRPFLAVPNPRGEERRRLIESFYEKKTNVRRPSKPLTPEMLHKSKGELISSNYNWLALSVWFGLRPQEVDNLKNEELWRIEKFPNGRLVLWLFQTKIVALPPEDRWKPIPIVLDEQKAAVKVLKRGEFKRPLAKTMRKHFGDGVTLYGGRKGFSDLMLSALVETCVDSRPFG